LDAHARFFSPEKNWMLTHDFFLLKKIEMFFFIFIISSDSSNTTTMAQQNQNQIQNRRIDRRNPEENGMNEYERVTNQWNQSAQVEELRRERSQLINNTAGYYTGYQIHHIRSIQMYDYADWTAIFGRENLNPVMREYAQASMEWAQDETCTRLYAGQMEVSLMMQENYRPGVHVAVFIIHLTPHRRFQDGHVIQMEFGEGSATHQTINRLFDPNTRAVVLQATEYQILDYVADDNEALDLLYYCFLDGFNTTRFSYVEPVSQNENEDEDEEDVEHGVNDEGDGYYIVNPYAEDDHNWHECAEYYRLQPQPQPVAAPVAIAIPPPPPVNDFAAIYFENLGNYYDNDNDNDNDNDDDDDLNENIIRNRDRRRRNINHYIYNGGESDGELPAQG
jgi:hypothetical protein